MSEALSWSGLVVKASVFSDTFSFLPPYPIMVDEDESFRLQIADHDFGLCGSDGMSGADQDP